MISRPTQTMWLVVAAAALGVAQAARVVETRQAGPAPQERVAALKQSMQESQTKLRQYEVVENKKDEMKDYMERATALVQQYVPPQPADIQRAKDAGKVTANPASAGLVRLEFPDYLKPGDRLSIDVDAAANQLRGLAVAS
jgi:hypothetical protein